MSARALDAPPFRFPEPLREGVILARPNRFIMDVDFGDGIPVRCHCPAVSRIGGLDLAGRPCLVSDSHNPKRKMPLTVEAFSLQQPHDAAKQWSASTRTPRTATWSISCGKAPLKPSQGR